MPGSIPATSQLDWLISTTAIIVLSWSRATRDLLKSFGWGIGALHRFTQRRWCHLLAACPIASLGRLSGYSARAAIASFGQFWQASEPSNIPARVGTKSI